MLPVNSRAHDSATLGRLPSLKAGACGGRKPAHNALPWFVYFTVESLLLTTARIVTFRGQQSLTNATGFFFERDQRTFLVTSRHVLVDEPSQHFPDRIEVELHIDPDNLAASSNFSILLYRDETSIWRQGLDSAGGIDVAVIEIDRSALPATAVYCAFTPEHLLQPGVPVEIGTPMLVVGFPLGFHDVLHRMPVARQAIVASAFGLRFQGEGYFLTDARTHRGMSGAPVVMRVSDDGPVPDDLPWMLLGVHSARMDLRTRDAGLDEALGLNCAWYADILLTLTHG